MLSYDLFFRVGIIQEWEASQARMVPLPGLGVQLQCPHSIKIAWSSQPTLPTTFATLPPSPSPSAHLEPVSRNPRPCGGVPAL